MNDINTTRLTATTLENPMLMDFNDTIECDGPELVILPEGDYSFRVISYRLGNYPGSPKIPACKKVSLTLGVDTDEGLGIAYVDLILVRSLEWRLASFFRCIGLKHPGRRMTMDWTRVPGCRGRARFKIRTYTDRNGEEHQVNDVERFYDFDAGLFPEPPDWVAEAESISGRPVEEGTM